MRLDHLLSKEPNFCVAGLFRDVVFLGWSCFWFLGGSLAFTMCCVVARCWVLRSRWLFVASGSLWGLWSLLVALACVGVVGGFWGCVF